MHWLRVMWWNLKAALKKPKRLAVAGILFIIILWFLLSQKTAHIRREVNLFGAQPCSDADSRMVIETICSLYKNGEITGELCEPLCKRQVVQFVQCLNYRHGKYVIQVECSEICEPHSSVTAVLKMSHANVTDLQKDLVVIGKELLHRLHLEKQIETFNINDYSITAQSLSLLLQELLNSEYGFTPREGQDMLSLLWDDDYGNYFKGTNATLAFARSFWSVVRQNEYRISKVFSDWKVFPNIYGSCGALYLAENAPGMTTFNKIYSLFVPGYSSWKKRARTAISILHLVQLMETMEHPLHLCDVKSPHFGITPNNDVKFIDADTVFADQTLNRDLGAPTCMEHSDCAFFDCDGWCKKDVGKCSPMRTNNNLQMVCAKIFQGSYLSSYGGLLLSPPPAVAAELTRLLNSCAEDVTEVYQGEITMRKPDLGLLAKLAEQLIISVNIDEN